MMKEILVEFPLNDTCRVDLEWNLSEERKYDTHLLPYAASKLYTYST